MNGRELIESWTRDPFPQEIREKAKEALHRFDSQDMNLDVEGYLYPLTFGTGGIRGKLGFGVGRMNEFTVGRAALGLCRYLKSKYGQASIVIAYDSRRKSAEFGKVTAGIAAKLGLKVWIFPNVTPTPILSYAIRYYKAQGGVVITASHNPPEYNGFKAYLDDGGQLVPPDDKLIIQSIESINDWKEIQYEDPSSPLYLENVKEVGPDCFNSYLKEISKSGILSPLNSADGRKSLKIVYSPLHGTGGAYMKSLLNQFGYEQVELVPEQAEPNGEFPTVKYPNPEEKEALEMSLALAKKIGADVVLASDPDADRLGVAVPGENSSFFLLNGNQLGSIMASYLCEKVQREKRPGKFHLIKTIVTTDLQSEIANKNNIQCWNVLTGFKYIAEVMKQLDGKEGESFLFGGEESYGYLPVDFVRDKDSLSSALLLLEILTEKKDLVGYLYSIYEKYGLFWESLKSITLDGQAGQEKIQKSLLALRSLDLVGKSLGGRKINAFYDFKTQTVQGKADSGRFQGLPTSDVLQLELEGNAKMTIRPSGTEPKIKIYSSFQFGQQVQGKDSVQKAIDSLEKEIKRAEEEFIQLAGLS